MAKTIAELSIVVDSYSARLDVVANDSARLRDQIGEITDRLHQARVEAAAQKEVVANLVKVVEDLRRPVESLDRQAAELRTETAVQKKSFDDHARRVEAWTGRFWTLVIVLVGAVLSLASGLIVTLARK